MSVTLGPDGLGKQTFLELFQTTSFIVFFQNHISQECTFETVLLKAGNHLTN